MVSLAYLLTDSVFSLPAVSPSQCQQYGQSASQSVSEWCSVLSIRHSSVLATTRSPLTLQDCADYLRETPSDG